MWVLVTQFYHNGHEFFLSWERQLFKYNNNYYNPPQWLLLSFHNLCKCAQFFGCAGRQTHTGWPEVTSDIRSSPYHPQTETASHPPFRLIASWCACVCVGVCARPGLSQQPPLGIFYGSHIIKRLLLVRVKQHNTSPRHKFNVCSSPCFTFSFLLLLTLCTRCRRYRSNKKLRRRGRGRVHFSYNNVCEASEFELKRTADKHPHTQKIINSVACIPKRCWRDMWLPPDRRSFSSSFLLLHRCCISL